MKNEEYTFEYVGSNSERRLYIWICQLFSNCSETRSACLRTPFGHAKERGLHVCKRNCFFSRYPLRYFKKEEYTTEFAIFEVVVGRCRWF